MTLNSGSILLRLHLRQDRVSEVEIECRRPVASRLLIGRKAQEAAALVPLLFAVCGKAQGLAARLALGAAQGEAVVPHPDGEAAREAAREHLWHLLSGDEHRDLLAQGTRCLSSNGDMAAFLAPLLGMAPDAWLALDADGINAWLMERNSAIAAAFRAAHPRMDGVPRSNLALLPALSAEQSVTFWPRLEASFAAQPTWQGDAAETGALARNGSALASFATSPLLQRRLARLIELAAYAVGDDNHPQPGTASAAPITAGAVACGRALVETARGLLMHEVTLEDERIADYQIVAPTEWNFHPQGALGPWLRGLPAASEADLHAAIRRRVEALDPCVPWHTERLPT
ncbi:MAG TPA: nickel-dependent hydrogenase large subunit [Rhodocyclaceae bacterium]|nr:nickel-dependent hydrogenase large subunit [Rhodocyclaceae bacterium]